MKYVAYMLDMSIWGKFAKNEVADYAIGGPTIELLFKAYNATHQTSYVAGATSNKGYQIKKQESNSWKNSIISMLEREKPYVISETTNAGGMWLASPSCYAEYCIMDLSSEGSIGYDTPADTTQNGFRPIVCLKSEIQLQKSDDGNYEIVNQQ